MTDNIRYGLIAIVILLFVWLLNINRNIDQENRSLESELIEKQAQGIHYSLLKKRWEKSGVSQKLLTKLSAIKAFDKQYAKGKNEIFIYENLDARWLDKLSFALFASDVIIVSFSIEKKGAVSSLSAEIKR